MKSSLNSIISGSSVCVVLGSVLLVSVALESKGYLDGDFVNLRHKRHMENVTCTLPPHPKHGEWKILKGNGRPDDQAPIGSVIKFECHPGYRISNGVPSVCIGQWSSQVPHCEKLCPPLYPSDTYNLKCTDKTGKKVECNEATHGTNLMYGCKHFYESPFGFKKTLFCEDGKWDSRPVCQPVCGKKITNTTNELIYGSKPSEKIEYPWVAAIYRKTGDSYENICGGSILSQTVILTAAHCVTDIQGGVLPKENYLVGVGKLYRKYLAPEDTHAQYSKLLLIEVPKEYMANVGKYAADIAVLVVKEEFVLNQKVQPVCFTNLNNIHLRAGNRGEVSGWGLAEGSTPSDVLRSLVIPFKYETVCADELPPIWADEYNLEDKICAGFFNQSTSVCKGDSGAGLAFKYHEDNRYYVHGVVSVGYKSGDECDIQQNSIYTRVTSYYDFVNRLLTTHAPAVKDCVLPPFPENGKWTTDVGDLKPGDAAPSNTVLNVTCEEHYHISSTEIVECGTAHTMPRCNRVCPQVRLPIGSTMLCIGKYFNRIDCSAAIDETYLIYFCPPMYVGPDGNNYGGRLCEKGSWESPEPECIRIRKDCGRKIGDSEIGNPWNVGIYRLIDTVQEKYTHVCGGSLVSQYAVLTDARCVTDEYGDVLPKDDFLIVAGKMYGKFNESKDSNTQIRNVSGILIHPEYQLSVMLFYDIALVVVKTSFKFNEFIQPVCLPDFDSDSKPSRVLMAGWRFEEDDTKEEVEDLEVGYLKYDSCELPNRSKFFLYVIDKKCVGFNNESICLLPEESGKGLVAKSPENGRYHLYGIVLYNNDAGCLKTFWHIDLFFYQNFINSAGYIS